jgi:DNA transformation protein
VFFGIVHDEMLYLKADAVTRVEFERAGCEIFSYSRKGKAATLNFYRAPEDAMDASPRMLPWGKRALEAALRARGTRRSRKDIKGKTAARGGRWYSRKAGSG